MGETRKYRRQRTQEREQEAWRLRCAGMTQAEVALALGVSQPLVCKLLAAVGARLAAEFIEEARSVKMRQTQVLETVAAEALLAWERSKEDAETVAVVSGRTTKEGDPLPEQTTRTLTGQTGNPAHLAQARGALADVRAIWALDAPQRQEHSGPGGAPIPVVSEIIVELPRPSDEIGAGTTNGAGRVEVVAELGP